MKSCANNCANFAFVAILMCLCVLLSMCTSSCSPYWKDQPTVPQNPDPVPNTPRAAPVPDGSWQWYTLTGTVNVHDAPDTSAPTIGWLLAGAKVRANCPGDGWCEVIGGYVVEGCLGVGEGICRGK